MKKIVWPLLPILLLFTCAELLQAQVKKVEAIGMTVKDLRRSVAFYRDVLGFSLVDQWEAFGEEYENKKLLSLQPLNWMPVWFADRSIRILHYAYADV